MIKYDFKCVIVLNMFIEIKLGDLWMLNVLLDLI